MTQLVSKSDKEALAKHVGRSNLHAIPRIERVIVNAGIGKRVVSEGKKSVAPVKEDLKRITGQEPVVRTAKKSVASFKLREGQPTGLVVTLRGKRAEDFLLRMVRTALPRMRDFRGIKLSAVDEAGNLNIGVPEQIVFPEAALEPTGAIFGLQVTVVTTARDREEGLALFRQLKFPFALEEEA